MTELHKLWLHIKLYWYSYESEMTGILILLGFVAVFLAYYFWKRSYYRKWNEAHGYLEPKVKKKKKKKKGAH